jgi:hypothetical protein
MALVLGKFKSATRVKLSDTLGITAKQFRQFVLYADPANGGSVYAGGSTVTGVPANEKLRLAAGASLNLGPDNADRPFVVDIEALYLIGSDANQICYVIANTDDGR